MLSRKRAVRYTLHAPVMYRTPGEVGWTEGRTINVSASGVLIVGDLPAASGEPITVVIPLPDASGCLTGWGRIVREPDDATRQTDGIFAIVVAHFSLERTSAALSRLHVLHQEC